MCKKFYYSNNHSVPAKNKNATLYPPAPGSSLTARSWPLVPTLFLAPVLAALPTLCQMVNSLTAVYVSFAAMLVFRNSLFGTFMAYCNLVYVVRG